MGERSSRVGSDILSAIAGRVGSTFRRVGSGRVQEKWPVDNSVYGLSILYSISFCSSVEFWPVGYVGGPIGLSMSMMTVGHVESVRGGEWRQSPKRLPIVRLGAGFVRQGRVVSSGLTTSGTRSGCCPSRAGLGPVVHRVAPCFVGWENFPPARR